MKPIITVNISIIGSPGAGKTRAIDKMVASLFPDYDILGQMPRQEAFNAETYTFQARLKSVTQ